MIEAYVNEFPFVQELPKREKSKIAKLWDTFREIKRVTDQRGVLLPANFVAQLLGVSRQRIYQLMDEGRLEVHVIDGRKYITEASMTDWAEAEHKSGRPVVDPNMGRGEIWKKAYSAAREWTKNPT